MNDNAIWFLSWSRKRLWTSSGLSSSWRCFGWASGSDCQLKHVDCWLVFVKDTRVPPTNNLAERTLRPLVIMRKICFGNRSRDGGQRLARIMSVKDTARRHGHNPLRVFYRLFTQPPDKVMRLIYKKTSAKKSIA